VRFETKRAAASASRNKLCASSTNEKAPSAQSSTVEKMEECMISALLANKAEKAEASFSITPSPIRQCAPIKKTLFAAMSPRQNADNGQRKQKRIKISVSDLGDTTAFRYENNAVSMPLLQSPGPKDNGPKRHGLRAAPLIAIGGIAVVLVGLLWGLANAGVAIDASRDVAALPRQSKIDEVLKSALPYFYWSPPRQLASDCS